jgi:hypothetical protein
MGVGFGDLEHGCVGLEKNPHRRGFVPAVIADDRADRSYYGGRAAAPRHAVCGRPRAEGSSMLVRGSGILVKRLLKRDAVQMIGRLQTGIASRAAVR